MLASFAFATQGYSQTTGIEVPELQLLENDFKAWLDSTYGTLSASLALAKDGKLVYARSFGKANLAQTTNAKPYHLYRIASMSKAVTGMMIMKLVDEGKLQLSNKVFGPSGILNDSYYNAAAAPNTAWLYAITVKDLLENGSGLEKENPHLTQMTADLGEPNPGKIQTLAKWIIRKPMKFYPGTGSDYNGVNFIIAAAIIEKKSGMSFGDYLSSTLRSIGIHDVKMGKSLMMQKQEREAEYPRYPDDDEWEAAFYTFYGENTLLPRTYGGDHYELSSGAGGVIGSPKDLVKFINAVNNSPYVTQLLTPASRTALFTPGPVNTGYAKGWGVQSDGSFQHNGGGPSHCSAWGYLSSGWSFAVIVAGHEKDYNQPGQPHEDIHVQNIERDVIRIIRNRSGLTPPNHNFFLTPTTFSTNLSAAVVSSTSATLSWTNGNGNKRVVVARAAKPVSQFPLDGVEYTSANAAFGTGTDLGEKNFVVYNGTGNSVTLSNLIPGVVYHVRVIEYNSNTQTGDHELYQIGGSPALFFSTVGQSTVSLTTAASNGTISQSAPGTSHAIGSKVVLIAQPAQGYQFSGWSGGSTSTSNPLELTMDGNKNITANFVPYVAKKSLDLYGNEGRAAVSHLGLNFPVGTPITFFASYPLARNKTFTKWDHDPLPDQTTYPLSNSLVTGPWWTDSYEAESAVTQSSFGPYTVVSDPTAAAGAYIVVPNGYGNASSVPSNGRLTFAFTNHNYQDPTSTYSIWARVKAPSSNDNNLYVRIDNESFVDTEVNVNTSWYWVKIVTNKPLPGGDHTVTIARREDGLALDKIIIIPNWEDYVPLNELEWCPLFTNAENGTVTPSVSNAAYMEKRPCHMYRSGTTVQLTASPKPGYQFTGWSGAVSGTTNPINLQVIGDKEVTANFAPINTQYALTTTNANGSITRSPNASTYASTTNVELTAIPNPGYQFTGWSGDASGLVNPITVNMNSAKSVTANFAAISSSYTLTANVSGSGSVAKSPNQASYTSGTIVQVTASPSAGYQFAGWSGAATGTTNPINVTMDANKTVTATFTLIPTGSEICQEAESALGQSAFANYQVYSDANASGGQYIMVPNTGATQGSPPSNSIAVLNFNIGTAGTYNIWLRTIADITSNNDVYLRVDATSYSSFTANVGASWIWKKWTSKSFTSGAHSLSVGMKEDGLKIDKILLTTSGNTPSGAGCTVSAREDVDAFEPMAEEQNTALFIAPNPTAGLFKMMLPASESGTLHLQVTDTYGNVVFENQVTAGQTMEYNGSHLASGLYFVKLQDGAQLWTKPVVIKK